MGVDEVLLPLLEGGPAVYAIPSCRGHLQGVLLRTLPHLRDPKGHLNGLDTPLEVEHLSGEHGAPSA